MINRRDWLQGICGGLLGATAGAKPGRPVRNQGRNRSICRSASHGACST